MSSFRPLDTSALLRVEIVDAMIRVLRANALHEVSYEHVATESGRSVEVVTELFPTTALLPIAERGGTILFLRAIVGANVADPSLMRFLTSTLNIAATPHHPLAPMLHVRWRRFHAFVLGALQRDVELGREPRTMEPARGAEQLLATYEGLQLQSMVRPEMDLLESFDRAVTRLREGWSREYVAPVWDLEVVGGY